MLADYVDGAFFCCGEVVQRVFCVGEAACEADCEEGGVVVYYLGVGEGGEVCRFAYRIVSTNVAPSGVWAVASYHPLSV